MQEEMAVALYWLQVLRLHAYPEGFIDFIFIWNCFNCSLMAMYLQNYKAFFCLSRMNDRLGLL